MPGEHAYFAPSASPRWLACPGSLALSEGISESTSSYAHEGTVCHTVAARCLKENLTADAFAGQTIEGVFMEENLIQGIQMYVDEVRGQTKEIGVKGGKIEFTVNVTEDCWGTLDAMLWNNELLLIDDLKMGKGVIVPGDTPQMKVYAIGGMKWLQLEHGLTPAKIRTVIIQPRTVDPIRPVDYTRVELIEWYKKVLMPTMEAVHKGAVKCVPGETQCRWCPAAGMCTAQAEFAIKESIQAFSPFATGKNEDAEKPNVSDPAENPLLDTLHMANLKGSFKFIEDWIGSINGLLMAMALKGDSIPGYKLVEGRSNRKWKGAEQVTVSFLQGHGIEPYGEKPLKTAPAIEKDIGKKKAKIIKLEEQIIKPKGAPTLVDSSDKRPVMVLNVEKEFKEFVESGPVIVETATSGTPKEDTVAVVGTEALRFDEDRPLTLMERLARADLEDEEVVIPEKAISGVMERMAKDAREDDPQIPEPDIVMETGSTITLTESEDTITMFKEALDGSTVPDFGKATGMTDVTDQVKKEETTLLQSAVANKPTAPKDTTKRHMVMTMGRGGASLETVAKALNCGVNSVKMHIRYLHERDGFGYELYSDDTFKITE